MYSQKILRTLHIHNYPKLYISKRQASTQKKVQVSVVGASNVVGSNVALLLKQNQKIEKLVLYDDDFKVKGMQVELENIPGGPIVEAYAGDSVLDYAVRDSHAIIMVHRLPRRLGVTRDQMIATHAPMLLKLCRAIANNNSEAFLAIATNPVNSMVPFASTLLYKYGAYNPFKILGITQLDILRARTIVARALKINPVDVSLPVIGGHSEKTIVPLFSSMQPSGTAVDPKQAATLTSIIRLAGTEVIYQKQGKEAASLAMAMSVAEFVDLLVDAIRGEEVTVNCYTANPNFGTRFFSGPTQVGSYGIVKACNNFQYNDYEGYLLNTCVPSINRDVELGEGYVRFIEMIGKYNT